MLVKDIMIMIKMVLILLKDNEFCDYDEVKDTMIVKDMMIMMKMAIMFVPLKYFLPKI